MKSTSLSKMLTGKSAEARNQVVFRKNYSHFHDFDHLFICTDQDTRYRLEKEKGEKPDATLSGF